jgi:DNA-binding XRE family transcriptional regulator
LRIRVDQVRTEKGFNPRSYIGEGKVRMLTQSLKSQLGQINAVLVQKGSNELIDGLSRLEASKRAKREYIEVIPVDVTDEQARRMALAANALTEKLHWLEIGKAADQILSRVPRHAGREKLKKELAKEIGVATHTLEVDIVAGRSLAPEAWELCLELAKKHLLRRAQIEHIWKLPVEKQVLLLRRLSEIHEDPITISRHLETFLAAEPREQNRLGRPRGSGKSKPVEGQSARPVAQAAPPAAQQDHDSILGPTSGVACYTQDKEERPTATVPAATSANTAKRERTEQKLREALRMDPVNLTELQIWNLAKELEPGLRKYTKLKVERWKIVEALRRDLETLGAKIVAAVPPS